MPSSHFLYILSFLVAVLATANAAGLPDKIYGVNLGSWLVLEPWMLPQEWVDMGGQQCDDCSKCIRSEYEFAKAYPKTVDATFDEHWTTWFNAPDVRDLVGAGINTVRIPLGYWIVEPLVNRKTEYFPKGGILQLRRGLNQLREAGIAVILDHHALPGVQSPNQMFTGRCTQDVQFYTPYNYHRALIWTGVMTALVHIDPAFSGVSALQSVNEPIMDASKTPGYGDFQKNFVQVVRAVELSLGIQVPGVSPFARSPSSNITTLLTTASNLQDIFNPEVRKVLLDMIPVLTRVALQIGVGPTFGQQGLNLGSLTNRDPIVTNFMDINWQYNGAANPADAKIGPQAYDNHLYYSFGGVADPTEKAYLTHVCNLDRIQKDLALRNTPLWFGEWGLSTQFSATDDFLKRWADAQKFSYGKGAGWIFWNFKIEISQKAGDTARQWSYMEGIRRGYLTKDPSKFHNPEVCAPYIKS